MADKLVASDAAYLDPLNCGSVLGYKITQNDRTVWATMDLSDCNRKIEWMFDGESAIEKIDKTIAMMRAFRTQLIKARRAKAKK